MARWLALGLGLIGALLWALVTALPPAPREADAPPAEFSAARAFAHVAAVARHPHPVASPENAAVRAYLTDQLRALGGAVTEQRFPLPAATRDWLIRTGGDADPAAHGTNLIAVFPGRNRALPALLLMAHHDSVVGSPAAADDGIGLAAILEGVRALRTGGQTARDVIVLFTDAEEMGLDGAHAFFTSHPLASRIGVIVNLEARGAGGRATMFETGPGNGAAMRLYAARVARPATNSLAVLVYDLMPNSTDYTIAKDRGIAGFNFGIIGRPWAYHSPLATPAALDQGSLQDMGDQLLDLSRALAFAPDLPAKTAANATFADILGRFTIVYPAGLGWVLLLVSAALIGFAGWRTRPPFAAIGGGALVTLAAVAHGMLLLTALNAVSGSGSAQYYDRLAAIPRLEWQAGLALAAVVALIPVARRGGARLIAIAPALALLWLGLLTGGALVPVIVMAAVAVMLALVLPRRAGPLGAALAVLALALAAQIAAPTAAHVIAWPLLLAAIGFAGRAVLPPRGGLALGAVLLAIGLGNQLPLAHFVFLAVGAELPAAAVAMLLPVLPLVWPLLPERTWAWLPALLVAAALVLALWVRLDPRAASVPTYNDVQTVKTAD